MSKACEKICDVLVEAGIDHVFGIPGGGTIPIWDALYDKQDAIKAVLTRHEQAASCMADMYGRVTGKPGVLMGQGAFVASSGAFGILEAYLSNSPMLVLTDTSDMGFSQHASYQSGTGEYGSFDIVGILRSMSKFTTYAVTPEEAVQGVQFAIKHAVSGRPGPACVVMRSKAVKGEIDPERCPRLYSSEGYLKPSITNPSAESLEEAVTLLLEAANPVIIAGNGIHLSKSYGELMTFAELLGAAVATSYKGLSAFPGVHPLSLGMMGSFGQPVANSTIADADLILVAGCHLGPSDTRFDSPQFIDPHRQKIIQIDVDPRNAGWTYPITTALIGDVKLTLKQLIAALGEKADRDKATKRISAVEKRKEDESYCQVPEFSSDAAPLLPQRIVREIQDNIDPETLITLDAGNNRLWMANLFKSQRAGTVFSPGGVAGMGWGPPASVAAKLLFPDRPVLSVVGDGGFAMMLHVLSTAAQYKLPVVFLVMNNSVLGMVHNVQSITQRVVATEFADTDYVQIALGCGCNGVRVEKPDELGPALRNAFKASVPTVLDVATERTEPFLKIAQLEDLLRVF
ncbi:MAG: thiamine pyrophosphate-binding protein [Deltaproteobacteria bacterium]|nr:thiamine pyrophosphate-binding protein [Deltaproteobacteria bacterium]